jgi:hypothetical protein
MVYTLAESDDLWVSQNKKNSASSREREREREKDQEASEDGNPQCNTQTHTAQWTDRTPVKRRRRTTTSFLGGPKLFCFFLPKGRLQKRHNRADV